jgi:hypothetical protein
VGHVTNIEPQDPTHTYDRSVALEWPSATFQIGDGHLALHSFDDALADQFSRLYGDCQVPVAAARGPRVECFVAPAQAGEVAVDVLDPSSVDIAHFMETVFADRGCIRVDGVAGGWHALESRAPRVSFRVRDRRVMFPAGVEWQSLAANLAVGMLLRLQQDVIYLHAGGVALGPGRRGVLFIGSKGAGKTTTALGLASRGHVFFGDEIVGVRRETAELVPVRRTVARRDGPCASAIDRALAPLSLERRRYADGQTRTMVPPSFLFAPISAPASLGAIVFLEGFGQEPALAAVRPSLETAAKLTPVTSTLWGLPQPARAFALVRLMASAPSYTLQLGPPDATARLLEDAFAH